MEPLPLIEDGITPTVKTVFSDYHLTDILDRITTRKVKAVLNWIDMGGKKPKNCLIIGSYLTGAKLANTLVRVTNVTVVDQHRYLQTLLDPGVIFASALSEIPYVRWDFIMDTTGLGGIEPDILALLPSPESFLVEDPCSEGSDVTILRHNQCFSLLSRISAARKGSLYTGGLTTKTSGTMTLMMEVIHRSIADANRIPGVLYSTSCLEHYERILFKEHDHGEYMARLNRPALIVSSLEKVDCDEIINKNLLSLRSRVIDFSGENNEG